MTLLVYGRTEYAEPLVELGTVADDSDVLEAYDGEWVELVVVSRGRRPLDHPRR